MDEIACDNCNKVFKRKASHIKTTKYDYCSHDCCFYHRMFNPFIQENHMRRKINYLASLNSKLNGTVDGVSGCGTLEPDVNRK